MCAVNSYVLDMAGITKDTPDPEGGKIGRDENGEPDGMLYETAIRFAMDLLPKQTNEKIANDFVSLGEILLSQGLDMGIRTSFSSDAPATSWATPSDPFINLKSAVTRKAWDGSDTGQEHRVDIETAIRLYTAEAAPLLGFTDVGILKEGYVADFIVLDRDILDIPSDKIDQVKVMETWINGEKVYER